MIKKDLVEFFNFEGEGGLNLKFCDIKVENGM